MEEFERPKINDKTSRLEEFLYQDLASHWNYGEWQNLLDSLLTANSTSSSDETLATYIRDTFERVLSLYPNAYKVWIKYVEFETKEKAAKRVEDLFSRCLQSTLTNAPSSPSAPHANLASGQVLHVELWKFYLSYIKRANGYFSNNLESPSATLDGRTAVLKAFEFALNNVGLDMSAGELWLDYIDFLKKWNCNGPVEISSRMDLMRKVFHSAIRIPMEGIERIWKEYDFFENGLKNKLVAKKLLGEKSPVYMASRTIYREGHGNVEACRSVTKSDPLCLLEEPAVMEQRLASWKKWLAWECGNPLKLAEDDPMFTNRILYAFKQGVIYLRHCPEVWFEYVSFLSEKKTISPSEDSVAIYKKALNTLPFSLSLHFSFAEAAESAKDIARVKSTFENLIETLEKVISVLGNSQESPSALVKLQDKLGEGIKIIPSLASLKPENLIDWLNLTFIEYIKTMRRSEGMKSARALFSRFRKSNHCSFYVYLYSAYMEYHCSKDTVIAQKIFEVGMKQFSNCPTFVREYLSFLTHINDDHNRRALFEKAVAASSATSEKDLETLRDIWDGFIEFENRYGDLTSILKLDSRRRESFPKEWNPFKSFVNRHSFMNLSCWHNETFKAKENESAPANLNSLSISVPELSHSSTPARVSTPSSNVNPLLMRAVGNNLNFKKPDLSKLHKASNISESMAGSHGTSAKPSEPGKKPSSGSSPPIKGNSGGGLAPIPSFYLNQFGNSMGPQLARFLGQLPGPQNFDGPIFNVDQMMYLFRDVIMFPNVPGVMNQLYSRPSNNNSFSGGEPPSKRPRQGMQEK